MNTFKCAVVSPNGIIFEGTVESLNAPGADGRFGIWAGHEHLVSVLTAGVLIIRADAMEQFYALDSGVLEVDTEHNVVILADQVLSAASLEEGEQKLLELSNPSD